jgi:hypothetical protein
MLLLQENGSHSLELKDIIHVANSTIVEYPKDVDNDDDLIEEREFYAF